MATSQEIALVAFDLDHTLLREETVSMVLAHVLGHVERMRYFETLRTQEEFARARVEMVSWYQAMAQEMLCSALSSATLAPGVHESFALLKACGIKTALVSTTWEFAVAWFAHEFGADFFVGTQLAPDGQITHFWSQHKPLWLSQLCSQLSLSLEQVAAVGDDRVDLPMLRAVGFPFFVGPVLLPGIEHALHYPAGDILQIAQHVLRICGREKVRTEV